ncbi:hypothetical protein [Trueperella abortisuis]|uniref:hypothetical protein n=1 Tax=Trueperella abortisuis TaxID=445930 RepID=UPI00289328D3|nr:hypothetical protein [Trueperella abortisuis]
MTERERRAAQCARSLQHWKEILEFAIERKWTILRCEEVLSRSEPLDGQTMVLRHDIDLNPLKALAMARVEHSLGITSTYFIRLHANEYNGLSHENLSILHELVRMGHEIGLHAEPVDVRLSSGLDSTKSILFGLDILTAIAGRPVGIASHGDITPDNNLDYFDKVDVRTLGALYEAYDDYALKLFSNSRYVSDGHIWEWRLFRQGEPVRDARCLHEHLFDVDGPIYALTHPHFWYSSHALVSYR